MSQLETRRGRPRKFAAPSRTVTLTLPIHTIDALTAVDEDLGRAIVRLAPQGGATAAANPAALTRFGRHAVIVVNPTRALAARIGVELIPLPDGRAIISFARSTTPAELELLLEDALDDRDLEPGDRDTFEAILAIIREARRSADVSLLQRSILVLESRRRPRRARR
jgi:hypothetical protein